MNYPIEKIRGICRVPWNGSRLKIFVLSALVALANGVRAQEGTQGNTTIFGGAQMTFFANHNFVTGGNGALPGIILTERAANNFGILNFSGDNLTSTGASDADYVDGYVRKYGAGRFIFPVGDNDHLGQFAATADGTMGAYFFANPATAKTSNRITGGTYPALPAGGPFGTGMANLGAGVKIVSNVEYWDIDGTNATPITLTWDASSNVSTLTGGTLSYLTIVGWNGSKWVRIPSSVDGTSIFGSTSTVNAGSVTTTISVVPNTYTAYTLAGVGPDLTPRITVSPNITHGSQVLEVVLSAAESGGVVATNGSAITVRVPKTPLLSNFVWNQAQTSAPANGNISVQNSIWTSSQDASYYIFTTTTVIPKGSQRRLVFYITISPGATDGSFNIPVSIPSGAGGGEVNLLNNMDTEQVIYFAN